MRKHILRLLVVMLLVCCGAFVFTACDDGESGSDVTSYTLTYLANGGKGDKITEEYDEGAEVTLKGADTFSREGYVFTKWKDGGTEYDAGASFTMPARNVTMSAQWAQDLSDDGETETYTVTLTVTGGDNNGGNTAKLDKEGEVEENETVTLTVTTASDYTADVKVNGTTVPLMDGKYGHTVTDDTAFTVTFSRKSGTGGGTGGTGGGTGGTGGGTGGTGGQTNPTNTEFGDANIVAEGGGFAIYLRLSAAGYADADTFKAAIKLSVGPAEFDATEIIGWGDNIKVVKFLFTAGQVGTLTNGDLAVVLKVGDNSYEKPYSVISAQNSVSLSDKTYTLKEQANKLYLTVADGTGTGGSGGGTGGQTNPTNTEFGDTNIVAEGDGFAIYLRLTAAGYADADTFKAAIKLSVGSAEFDATEIIGWGDNIKVVKFLFTAGQAGTLTNGDLAAVLKVGDNSYEKPYSVISAQNSVSLSDKTYTLKEQENKLYLTVADGTGTGGGTGGTGTGGQTNPTNTEFGDTNIVAEGDGFAIYLRLTAAGYADADTFKAAIKLSVGSAEFDATEIIGWGDNIKVVKFLFTAGQVGTLTNGDLAVVLKVGDNSYEKPYSVISGGQYKTTLSGKTYTLKAQADKLYLEVKNESA